MMKKDSYSIFGILTMILLSAILAGSCARKPDPGEVLYSEFRQVDKLVLARMAVSKMATIDDLDLKDAVGLKQTGAAIIDAVKIGDRKAAYSYDTYLRAYIDMSDFSRDDIYVDDDSHTIQVRLPEILTEYAGRDAAIREEHYRVTGLRSSVSPRERAEMKERMNDALKKEVESNPEFRRRLVEAARSKGVAFFTSLADIDGYTVIVSFKEETGGVL